MLRRAMQCLETPEVTSTQISAAIGWRATSATPSPFGAAGPRTVVCNGGQNCGPENDLEPLLQSGLFMRIEREAVRRLTDAGYEAFINPVDSHVLGGVAVRISPMDARLRWSRERRQAVPEGFAYSEYAHTYVLHAGRVMDFEDSARLQDFVRALLEASYGLGSLASAAALAKARRQNHLPK